MIWMPAQCGGFGHGSGAPFALWLTGWTRRGRRRWALESRLSQRLSLGRVRLGRVCLGRCPSALGLRECGLVSTADAVTVNGTAFAAVARILPAMSSVARVPLEALRRLCRRQRSWAMAGNRRLWQSVAKVTDCQRTSLPPVRQFRGGRDSGWGHVSVSSGA
jgi:hypothetical protein